MSPPSGLLVVVPCPAQRLFGVLLDGEGDMNKFFSFNEYCG